MRIRWGALVLAAVLAMATTASNARAQLVPGQEIAKKLFDEGLEAEKQKDWATALGKFKESEAIKPTPGNRFHKAYCLEMTGKLASALDEYEGADKLAQAEKKNEVHEAIRARYEPLLKRVPQLSVKASTIPKDAKVNLDGVPISPVLLDGRPFRIDPGDHAVTARAHGYETFAKNFNLAEGTATTTIEVVLNPEAKTPPPAGTASRAEPITEPPREGPPSKSKTLPIVTTVGAGVFLATGIITFVVAGSAQSDAEKKCPTKVSCESEQTKVRTFDAFALAGFIGAAGLGALSIVLWTSSSGSGTSASIATRPSWVGIEGAF
jgi:hypothetical protein